MVLLCPKCKSKLDIIPSKEKGKFDLFCEKSIIGKCDFIIHLKEVDFI